MPFFSRVFKHKDGPTKHGKRDEDQTNGFSVAPVKPRYTSTWDSTEIVPEEVEELIHLCTLEMKARAEALDTPFLLLPFRPETDVTPTRTFMRNFYKANREGSHELRGQALQKELRLTEPEILCSIVKWCWSRIPGGVVSWPVYEGFKIGELEAGSTAHNAFDTFIPLSVDSESRKNIIVDFFDLLASIAAHGKVNGLGGRKISRLAGWWAFEHSDDGAGFDGGYKSWDEAADASSHLFFAYLRSRAPDAVKGISGISNLPRSMQALVAQTEYPPEKPTLLHTSTSKVIMMVDSVSPTPFALLRRAKHFEYRSEDRALQRYSNFLDPVEALTEECRRVLDCIATANQSTSARSRRGGNLANARLPSGLSITGDDSWSRFQDEGFSSMSPDEPKKADSPFSSNRQSPQIGVMQSEARTRGKAGDRPTTPSWADFLNAGFTDDSRGKGTAGLMLPPDKQLPPIDGGRSLSTHGGDGDDDLEPGELASITRLEMDDTFWWVWMTSLSNEEPMARKAVFGRCALIETSISGGKWFVMEEQVKGASPAPEDGAYIAEKKSRFGFSRRNRSTRKKVSPPQSQGPEMVASASAAFRATSATPAKGGITPDQQAKIRAAAAQMHRQQGHLETPEAANERRGRHDDASSSRTNSVLTLGLSNAASPAMQWAKAYDKEEIRQQYLGNNFAGRGLSREELAKRASSVNMGNESQSFGQTSAPSQSMRSPERQAPLPPMEARPESSQVKSSDIPSEPLPPPPQSQHGLIVNVEDVDDEGDDAIAESVPQTTSDQEHTMPSEQPAISEESLHHDHENQMVTPEPEPLHTEPAAPHQAQGDLVAPAISAPKSPSLRKPIPAANLPHVHPAFRPQAVAEEGAGSSGGQPKPGDPAKVAAARAFWQHHDTTLPTQPAMSSKDHKKLQKKPVASGSFKNMFHRKKDNPNRRSVDIPAQELKLPTPKEGNGNRLSLLRRNQKSPELPTSTSMADTVEESSVPHEAFARSPQHQQHPSVSEYDESEGGSSFRPDTQERQHAHNEFARFDQGPLTDEPAFVPENDFGLEDDATPTVPRRDTHHADDYLTAQQSQLQREESQYATPLESVSDDKVSVVSGSDVEDEAAPYDRWAQIRKNAAERAARASEEQSTRSRGHSVMTQGTEAASETSNEETIEERVARIKARVAELTGNADKRDGAQARSGRV